MFTPEFQRMDTLVYSQEAIELLDYLMGEEVDFRKDFIFNNVDFSEIKE
jgi:DNA gyrase/topoisomerase IV subunit B